MKLTFKIMAAVMLVVAMLLALHSYLVVQREVELFRADMNLHAYLVGSVLASSVADIWKSNGRDRVESIIEDANRSERLVQVRWVWFDVPPDDPSAPRANIEDLAPLQREQELLFPEYSYRGSDYHLAYFPVRVDSARLSALELSQPLAPMRSYIRNTIIRKIALFVAFLFVGGGLVWWLGIRLVGRPVHSLVDQARAVGTGDLTAHSNLEHLNDEIGELALGFNTMVKDLRFAQDRLEEETSGRLSAMEQLSHAERLATVGKLASGLAHELGTPLNVIAGRAKMISSEEMEQPEVLDSAVVIQNQAERMTGIIRQLLDFARSKSVEKNREALLNPINNVVHLLTPIAAQDNIDLILAPGDETTHVKIDTGQIQQVLSNIIVNAIHAMKDGGQITVRCGQRSADPPADHGGATSEYAYVDVLDEGVGIAKENLNRVFTPFFSTKQVGEGTGLGLSIAHGIVKDHGGWLTVQSTEGEGTTFTVYLPIGERA